MLAIIISIIVLGVAASAIVISGFRRGAGNSKVGKSGGRTLKADKRQTVKAQKLTGRDFERRELQIRKDTALENSELFEPALYVEPDIDAVGVTRRQFLNRTMIGATGLGLAGFGGSALAFLWPSFSSGFGAKLNLGEVGDVVQQVRTGGNFLYVPEGRMWITEYPASSLEKAKDTYSAPELGGIENGLIALYQKCPHLGCRVPSCLSSQWFECPCHGSQYNRVGEKTGGPAPRGLDRFAMSVNNRGEFIVDTGTIVQGPPIGVNTTGQEAEGPNCIGQASE